ncbi:MAG: hypothetical protein GY771_12115, partial [bacterium]|nr:hypothetical protein [bacterium]
EKGVTDGAVLVVDGFERLSEEEKGLLQYVVTRIRLAVSESENTGVYLAITGSHATLDKQVASVVQGELDIQTTNVPPLQNADIEEIVTYFRGKIESADDRRNLSEFISRYDDSARSVITVLNDALLKNALSYAQGRWRFRPLTDDQAPQRSELLTTYYRDFVSELPLRVRELLDWICCHHGPIPIG